MKIKTVIELFMIAGVLFYIPFCCAGTTLSDVKDEGAKRLSLFISLVHRPDISMGSV